MAAQVDITVSSAVSCGSGGSGGSTGSATGSNIRNGATTPDTEKVSSIPFRSVHNAHEKRFLKVINKRLVL